MLFRVLESSLILDQDLEVTEVTGVEDEVTEEVEAEDQRISSSRGQSTVVDTLE